MAPHLSIIIPLFNNWELTQDCLAGLDEFRPPCPFEVIAVDNGSTDATREDLAAFGTARFGGAFRRIRFEDNRNFGPGCNAGARAAAAPFLFFLNNDTRPTSGWARPLLDAFADDPCLGAAGPLLLYEDGTVQHLGICFGLPAMAHLYRGFPAGHPVVARTRPLQAITGAALLVPAALFRELGGFYEEYHNGYEDVDLCLRIGKLGKSLRCVPESAITHLESKTAGRNDHEARNAALLTSRCGALIRPDKHLLGSRDGFAPFITDSWSVGLAMRREKEEALDRAATALGPEERYALTREHPYWISGRLALAEALLASESGGPVAPGNVPENAPGATQTTRRLLLLAEAAAVLDSAAAHAALARAARTAGDAILGAAAEAAAARLAASRMDRARALQCRRLAVHAAVHAGDGLLERLIDEKLRETAP